MSVAQKKFIALTGLVVAGVVAAFAGYYYLRNNSVNISADVSPNPATLSAGAKICVTISGGKITYTKGANGKWSPEQTAGTRISSPLLENNQLGTSTGKQSFTSGACSDTATQCILVKDIKSGQKVGYYGDPYTTTVTNQVVWKRIKAVGVTLDSLPIQLFQQKDKADLYTVQLFYPGGDNSVKYTLEYVDNSNCSSSQDTTSQIQYGETKCLADLTSSPQRYYWISKITSGTNVGKWVNRNASANAPCVSPCDDQMINGADYHTTDKNNCINAYTGSSASNPTGSSSGNEGTTSNDTGTTGGQPSANPITAANHEHETIEVRTTVRTKSGNTPVVSASVSAEATTSSGEKISDAGMTDGNGSSVLKLEKDKGLGLKGKITVKATKSGKSDQQEAAWAEGQANVVIRLTLDLTEEQALKVLSGGVAGTANYVAPTGGISGYPGGNAAISFKAVRESLHSQNKFTPVGGVSFSIDIKTTKKNAGRLKSTQNKALAAETIKCIKVKPIGEYSGGYFWAKKIDALWFTLDENGKTGAGEGFNDNEIEIADSKCSSQPQPPSDTGNVQSPNSSGQTGQATEITSADIPYNQEYITPYEQTFYERITNNYFVSAITGFFGQLFGNNKQSFTIEGTIPDNGLNSGITIKNLPEGIYKITLSKNGYKSSRWMTKKAIPESGIIDLMGLPIQPNSSAEPPSIGSAEIVRYADKDLYETELGGKTYIYISKYPWFGWQEKVGDQYPYGYLGYNQSAPLYQIPGIPSMFTPDGIPIGAGGQQTSELPGGLSGLPPRVQADIENCIKNKMEHLKISTKGLKLSDIIYGLGAAYAFKQSGKQNNEDVKNVMIAGGILGLAQLAKSDAEINLDYEKYEECYNSAYQNYQNWGMPLECRSCPRPINGLIIPNSVNCPDSCVPYSPALRGALGGFFPTSGQTGQTQQRQICGGFTGAGCPFGYTCQIQSGDLGYCVPFYR